MLEKGDECHFIRLQVAPEPEIVEKSGLIKINEEVLNWKLENFKSKCEDFKKELNEGKTRKRKVYHQLGLMAKIDTETTDIELMRLLVNETRTFLISWNMNRPQDVEKIFLRANTAMGSYLFPSKYNTPLGLAVEIHGEQLATGRMRNNLSVYVSCGQYLVLTIIQRYKYVCFREIMYVTNLYKYLPYLKIDDYVSIGRPDHEVCGRVVKLLNCHITLHICKPGELGSYENVQIPMECYEQYIKETTCDDVLSDLDRCDIHEAIKMNANFVAVRGLRDKRYAEAIHCFLESHDPAIKLIASLDLNFLSYRVLEVTDFLDSIHALWINDLFTNECSRKIQNFTSHVVGVAQCVCCPIIATVPLRKCSDFARLENHKYFKFIDTMLIEKSAIRNKYPLIVKKLLPVTNSDFKCSNMDGPIPGMKETSCRVGILRFIERLIWSIPCRVIIIHSVCPSGPLTLATSSVYCPVIAVITNPDCDCCAEIARSFNLHRNIKSVIMHSSCYTDDLEEKAISFGIEYARTRNIIATGDFLVTLGAFGDRDPICETEASGVNMRGFYLPPNICP